MTIYPTSDVTIEDIVITGFNTDDSIIYNEGNMTVNGCTFINNTLSSGSDKAVIYNKGNLTIVESGFNDNILDSPIVYSSLKSSNVIINESTFENNTNSPGNMILIRNADSVKIISTEFVENRLAENIIDVIGCGNVLINSAFINNTEGANVIHASGNSNLLIEDSIFTSNTMDRDVIQTIDNKQSIISGCTFTDNAVENVIKINDKNISVLESTFTANTLSENGALYIGTNINATVDNCVFTDNNAGSYRNIYSDNPNVKITNTVFDAMNVDFSVYDIDYGQNETIEGTIDIGTNLNFTANLVINGKTY